MNVKKISPEELYERMKNDEVFLLDVRAEDKFNDYHIEGTSCNIPKTKIFEMEEKNDESQNLLSKEHEIVVTCTTGNSAAKCAAILSKKDHNVLVLEGGITAWKEFLKTLDR